MKKNLLFIVWALFCISCSSPESDGKKAAGKFCDCEQEYTKNLNEKTQKFIDNFADYDFTTRVGARKKSEELINEATRKYNDGIRKAEQTYAELKGKYVGNFEKTAKFEYAYSAKKEYDAQNINHDIPNQAAINNLILTVIPPKPDSVKIKQDLIGRRIIEQPGGYHRQGWCWTIEEGEIKDFEIQKETKQGDDYLFELRLVVQGEGCAYEAFVNVTYVLRQNDDWTIDFLESKKVNVVRTGKYDNCISITKGDFGRVYFTNHCDVTLMVGGVVYNDGWEKFLVKVRSNSTDYILGTDYKIHFIERP